MVLAGNGVRANWPRGVCQALRNMSLWATALLVVDAVLEGRVQSEQATMRAPAEFEVSQEVSAQNFSGRAIVSFATRPKKYSE